MRFVVFISESQQTLQEEYRVRARIIRERTALRNEIRGLLSEFGLLLPVGIRHVRKIQQGILPRGSGMTLHPFVVRNCQSKMNSYRLMTTVFMRLQGMISVLNS